MMALYALLLIALSAGAYLAGPPAAQYFLGSLVIVSIASFALGKEVPRRLVPLLLATCLIRYFGGVWAIWPFQFLLPVILAVLFMTGFQVFRTPQPALTIGYFDKPIALAAAVIGLLAVAVLLAWQSLIDPQLFHRLPSRGSAPLLYSVLFAGGFAFINALVEEAYFRGILQSALQASSEAIHVPVLLQALFFGLVHFGTESVPNGYSGALLTFIFALVLGYMRVVTRGLAAPILAHIIADLGVYLVLS
jgi:membrane protease YdiL (CAAX protease family)